MARNKAEVELEFNFRSNMNSVIVDDSGAMHVWEFRKQVAARFAPMGLQHGEHYTVDIMGSSHKTWRVAFETEEAFAMARMIFG